MKIRIKGNSVRFRLTQSEVATFCETGRVSEKTNFGETVLVYSVIADSKSNTMKAEFQGMNIKLSVPKDRIEDWNNNTEVGFYHEMPLKDGYSLSLSMEKDFTCLTDRGEDESDNYPNPKASVATDG